MVASMFFHFLLSVKRLSLWLISLSLVALPVCAAVENPKILIYGDSLSASYGLPQAQGWGALLQKKLTAEHYPYTVVNASISGETTSGGSTRFATALTKFKPSIIILELGANDGLRGLPIQSMSQNLNNMIVLGKKSKAKILLVGMKIPPNYGPKYTALFSQTYLKLSQQHEVALVPFMLENIAAKPSLIQEDGLHPNALGQPLILDNIWPKLKPLLKKQAY
jgi:acyl-CoA thioesterase-1